MTLLRTADLDRRIAFERPVADASLDGAGSGTWVRIAEGVPAQVREMLPSRSERVVDGQTVATRGVRIRYRWRGDITGDMRVLLLRREGGAYVAERTLQIISGPVELGRRDGSELMAEEYSPAGNTA